MNSPNLSTDPQTDAAFRAETEDAPGADATWIHVIRKMDETYADLIRHQTELEAKNSALEDAQQFIASVLASMTDVLIVCDVQGRIQQVNRALEVLTGWSEADLRGRPFLALLAEHCLPMASGFAEQIRARDIHDCELELKGVAEEIPLAVNCTSRYDHRGRLVGMVLIGRPLGELRRAYRDLAQAHDDLKRAQGRLVNAEKMASLGRLVAGVAHELNNPISFVYGNVHALARYRERLLRYCAAVDAADPSLELQALKAELRIERLLADLDPLIKGTLEGAERVRDLVQDLRCFSSAQQGEATRFDLVHLIRTAVHWVTKGERREIETRLDLPEMLTLRGHPGQIHQVLMNLVQNALDAMRDGARPPRLLISAGQDATTAWLNVRDNGPGIDDQDLSRIFDPFFTTKPVGQGTGLGLSISYGIVADHRGSLSAANHPEGGAEFRLELPLDPVLTPGTGPDQDALYHH